MKSCGLILASFLLLNWEASAQTVQLPAEVNAAAEDTLILTLRTDPNEISRQQAAFALGESANCTKYAIAALLHAASGGNADGYPVEMSPCVRTRAARALQVCLIAAATRDLHHRQVVAQTGFAASGVSPSHVLTASRKLMTAYYLFEVAQGSDAEMIDRAYRYLAENLSARPEGASAFDQTRLVPPPIGTEANGIAAPWPVLGPPDANRRNPLAFTGLPDILKQK